MNKNNNSVRYSFEMEGLETAMEVLSFSGDESLFGAFEYTIQLVFDTEVPSVEELMRRTGTLTIRQNDIVRYVNGVVVKLSTKGAIGKYSIVEIVLAPLIALLDKRTNFRIFQNQTACEIAEEVLQMAGVPSDCIEQRLEKYYGGREYSVQYGESDKAFVERLLYESGLFYYFVHEKGKHTLVITDSIAQADGNAQKESLSYKTLSGQNIDQNVVYSISATSKIEYDALYSRNYDYQKPHLDLSCTGSVEPSNGQEKYEYPAKYNTSEEGESALQIGLQRYESNRSRYIISSNSPVMKPGLVFQLEGHPDANLSQEYLVVGCKEQGEQPQVLREYASTKQESYGNTSQCIPAGKPYQPLRSITNTRIYGVQTAIVTGPEGEEIYTDELGRVKVQFHWDRQGLLNENSSCWVRVGQVWSGAGWGAQYVPRVGQEVIVSFVDGDPERPLITGQLYHGINLPPYELPQHKAVSGIKSNSLPDGGGYNEIRMDDTKDGELLSLHAQKDFQLTLNNDSYQWIGNESHAFVKSNDYKQIDGDQHRIVLGDSNASIKGNVHTQIEMDEQRKTAGDFAYDAEGDIHLKAGNKLTIEAGAEITIKVGGNFIKIDSTGITAVGSLIKLNSGGSPGSGKGTSLEEAREPVVAKTDQAASETERPERPTAYSPPALTLKNAAIDGSAYCESCGA